MSWPRLAGVDRASRPEPLAEARALDLEVRLVTCSSSASGTNSCSAAMQDVAEDLGQPLDARLGLVGIDVDELRDRVEAVEEEVRVDLRAQRGELRRRRELGELALARLQRLSAPPDRW